MMQSESYKPTRWLVRAWPVTAGIDSKRAVESPRRSAPYLRGCHKDKVRRTRQAIGKIGCGRVHTRTNYWVVEIDTSAEVRQQVRGDGMCLLLCKDQRRRNKKKSRRPLKDFDKNPAVANSDQESSSQRREKKRTRPSTPHQAPSRAQEPPH